MEATTASSLDLGAAMGNQALLADIDVGKAAQANIFSDVWNYFFGDDKKEEPKAAPAPAPAPAPALDPAQQKAKDEQDAFRTKMKGEAGYDENREGYRMAGFRIGQGYDPEGRFVNGDQKVALNTPEERLAAINGLTQNDETGQGQDRCGATSLLAAAMVGGGNDGVKSLIDILEGGEISKGSRKELDAIKKRIAKGEQLSMADIQAVQEGLHSHLRKQQKEQIAGEDDGGVDGKIIQNFISDNESMKKIFKDYDMSIDRIDNDGDDKGNHFVLNLGTPRKDGSKVYDPFARKGGQVISDKDTLNDYDLARKHSLTPQG